VQTVRKNSKKRQALLDAICNSHEHPTAEMLYSALKPMIPELSLGTVYRNLGVLVQEGQIISVGHINGQERYDAVTHAHPHFVCKSCGSVTDLELPDMVSPMFGLIDSSFHCEPQSYNLTINGLCHKCRS
jgi:Fur family peroxide stress response transcriptional regulator